MIKYTKHRTVIVRETFNRVREAHEFSITGKHIRTLSANQMTKYKMEWGNVPKDLYEKMMKNRLVYKEIIKDINDIYYYVTRNGKESVRICRIPYLNRCIKCDAEAHTTFQHSNIPYCWKCYDEIRFENITTELAWAEVPKFVLQKIKDYGLRTKAVAEGLIF